MNQTPNTLRNEKMQSMNNLPTMPPPSDPTPGFHPDGGVLRLWDGQQWTAVTRPLPQPEPQPQPPQPLMRAAIAPKNPGIAVVLSMLIPGLGHLYAYKTAVGVTIMFLNFVIWLLTIGMLVVSGQGVGFFLLALIWIGAAKYAYRAAVDFNQRNGIEVR